MTDLEKKAIELAFEKAEEEGLLRFRVLPDEEMYDDSYIDTGLMFPTKRKSKRSLISGAESSAKGYGGSC